MRLTKENDEVNISADILDLTVELGAHSRKVNYKLYDKRDKFKFSIVNYPDLGGNIAKACGYGVVKSELKRYSRLSSKLSDFLICKKLLFDKVSKKRIWAIWFLLLFN